MLLSTDSLETSSLPFSESMCRYDFSGSNSVLKAKLTMSPVWRGLMALDFMYTTASFNPRRVSVTSYCDSDLIKDLSGPLSLYCNRTALTFLAACSRRERRMNDVDVTGGELSLVTNWGYRSVESEGIW